MTVDFFKLSDIPAIAEIEKQSFSVVWSEKQLEEELSNKTSVFFVARDGDKPVGYIIMNSVMGEAFISRVATHIDYRRRGVANTLLNALDRYAYDNDMDYITLEVRVSNAPAISLYEKFGFKRFSLRKNFYSNPTEDAVIYTKYYKERQ